MRADDESFLSGWMHIPRTYFFVVGIKEAIQDYILIHREFGRIIDVTVENLPGVLFNTFNRLVEAHGLKLHEKQK